MERRRYRQRQRAAHAAFLRDIDRALDGALRAGDDDLSRRVDVGDGDDLALRRFFADRAHFFDGRPDQRGHAAGADRHGFLHEASARAHDRRRLGGREAADADDGAVLAEGVAGHEIAPRGAVLLEHGVKRGRDREDGRLRVLGELELILGTLEAERGDGEAEGGVDVVEDPARRRILLGDIPAHPGVLTPLAREDEGGVMFHGGGDDLPPTRRSLGCEPLSCRDRAARG